MRLLQDLLDGVKAGVQRYMDAVEAGADPIEALHGHYCGPHCWHWETLPEDEKERLRQAPWNQRRKDE